MQFKENTVVLDRPLERLRAGLAQPPADAAPMMRWWWFGPRVDRAGLRRDLESMRAAGIGGVEVSFVYPLSGDTGRFLDERFLADLKYAAHTANGLGMRMDVTLGSGWSYGGPHIGPETAARRMHWDAQEITPEAVTMPLPVTWPHEQFVAAYIGDGSIQEMPTEYRPLESDADSLHIPAGLGPRVILVCTSRLTGQNVKRAAHGAEGPVLDHYSRAAIDAHLSGVCEPIVNALPEGSIGAVFCDSLEAYNADWTPDFVAEFTARRGYDPLPELWKIAYDADGTGRMRADMSQTLSELYEDNFLRPLRAWAQSRGLPLRVQSYGEPPARLSSYRHADQFEGEGWGWRDIPPTRWASSAARIYGKNVVSSETWTWIHSPSYRATPLDLKGEAHEHVLCGINHFFGHGWPHSPAGEPGVGWMLYAAGALDTRNPWWGIAPELWGYMHRLGWVMRQGTRVARVGIYAPSRDVTAARAPGSPDALNLWRGTSVHIGTEIPAAVRDSGQDFDLFDDPSTAVLAPDAFDVIVLPRVRDLPDNTREWIEAARAVGVYVIGVDEAPLADVVVEESGLQTLLDERCDRDGAPVSVAAADRAYVGMTRRQTDEIDIWFVANTGASSRTVHIDARAGGRTWEQWDLADGSTRPLTARTRAHEVVLAPYEALVLVGADGQADVTPDSPEFDRREVEVSEWSVQFPDSAAETVTLPHCWEQHPGREHYSGSAVYRANVRLDEACIGGEIWFGETAPRDAGESGEVGIRGRSFRAGVTTPIGEVAEVRINGTRVGAAWSAPYRVEFGSELRAGDNVIEVIVSNTLANALAVDPTVSATASRSTLLFGQRFRMQDLELAADALSSGLHVMPRITVW